MKLSFLSFPRRRESSRITCKSLHARVKIKDEIRGFSSFL